MLKPPYPSSYANPNASVSRNGSPQKRPAARGTSKGQCCATVHVGVQRVKQRRRGRITVHRRDEAWGRGQRKRKRNRNREQNTRREHVMTGWGSGSDFQVRLGLALGKRAWRVRVRVRLHNVDPATRVESFWESVPQMSSTQRNARARALQD